MSDGYPPWVPWGALALFLVGLYGGYANGGTGGFTTVWVGASGLATAVMAAGGDQ